MYLKRIVSLMLTLCMCLTMLPATTMQANAKGSDVPLIVLSNATGVVGKQVQIKLSLVDNPGIISMMLQIGYDPDVLELLSVTDAGKLGEVGHSDNFARNPYILSWENDLARKDFVVDGEIATLTFLVKEGAPVGESAVTVSYTCDNYEIFNAAGEEVWFETVNGSVNVIGGLLGDLDLNGLVNSDDLTLLARHVGGIELVDGQALLNADVNGDGKVNSDDLTKHARYVGGIITDWDQE